MAAMTLVVAPIVTPEASAQGAPNVIVIISDDAGYADFGFMDGLSGETSVVPTPNLDALAARGVTMSNAYTAMVCSPSRAAITTGGYQQRVGYEYNINNLTSATGPFEGLPVDATTIWERMKSVGYNTGAVGKWHIGSIADTSPTEFGNRPQRQGVDEFYGLWRGSRVYNVGGQTNETRVIRETLVDSMGNVTDTVVESAHSGEYITETFGQYAVDYIADHHDDAEPFFLYQAFTAPHGPLNNSPDFNDPRLAGLSGNRKQYASMMLTMDDEIGRILDTLEDPNDDGDTADSITDDTLIIFINDNGGASSNASDNGVLRDFKGTPYEGGIRVPMIIAGAGVDPSVEGTVYDKPVHSIDILPTAFAAGGGTFGPGDTGIDGVNLLPYINGTNTSDPHEVIVVRSSDEVGVRKGDWKLVKNGIGANFQLFNLATDISESTNVAGANPMVVAELQRDLTEVESEYDKPRFAELNASQDTVNIFDHFAFRPEAGGAQPGPNLLDNPGFENGTQLDANPFYTFEELDAWSNNGDNTSPAKDEVAARDDNANSGAYRGLMSGLRTHYQVTDHVIALGEEFSINLAHSGQFSQWDVGVDSFDMELFYLDGGNNVVVLDTINVVPAGTWTTTSHTFAAITDSNAVGRMLGIRFDSLGGNSEFAGLDDIVLGLSSTSPVLQMNWSAANAWVEGGTSNLETMFHMDAFAGAILEFPTTDSVSYVSTNDMTRSTGLEFMLNKLVLSGAFNGTEDQSGTIEGNALLFTDSLDGVGPQIALNATNGGGGPFAPGAPSPQFTYSIDLDVVMFDDLTIAGNGSAELTINGQVRDYFDPRNLTKTGLSKVFLAGDNTYAGNTTVAGGTFALVGSATLGNTPHIAVQSGAVFDVSATDSGGFTLGSGQTLSGSGSVVGNIDAAAGATVSPGSSIGTLSMSADYTQDAAATLAVEVDGASDTQDLLAVAGNATLAGSLTVDQLTAPDAGDEFVIVTGASVSGVFDQAAGIDEADMIIDAGASLSLGIIYEADRVKLVATFKGDANGDGDVSLLDLNALGAGFGQVGTGTWQTGDFNYDGDVSLLDLNALGTTFGNSVAAAQPAVPEPTGLALLSIGSLALLRRRFVRQEAKRG